MAEVTKAVIAAAGSGTRFLPATKAVPKEMLPIFIDGQAKPVIQHVAEELVEAGIEDIIIVTKPEKAAIKQHFSPVHGDLRANLINGNKHDILEQAEKVSRMANFIFVMQEGPYGNGTPLLNAEHLLGHEPFAYTFADDFVGVPEGADSRFAQLLDTRRRLGGTVLTCIEMGENEEDYLRYGFVGSTAEEIAIRGVKRVKVIMEKPGSREAAPSDLATVGGYVFDPAIFSYLHRERDAWMPGHELTIQGPMQQMIDDGHKIFGHEIEDGIFHDTGTPDAYVNTLNKLLGR